MYFLVRKAGEKGCHIHYNAIPDYARAEEKKAYLRDNEFANLKFESIHPDKNHNWINQAEASDWDTFLPVASKESKAGKTQAEQQTIFKLFSLGIVSARDEWLYDFDLPTLKRKVKFFAELFNAERERWAKSKKRKRDSTSDFVDRTIKWTSELETQILRGTTLSFSAKYLTTASYRPFVKQIFYYDRIFVHRTYQWANVFPIGEKKGDYSGITQLRQILNCKAHFCVRY